MSKSPRTFLTIRACAILVVVVALSVSPIVSSAGTNPLTPGTIGTELEECKVFGKISLVITGGQCSGTATADCHVQATRLVEVQNIVKAFLSTDPCVAAKAEASAKSVATAIARVHASSLVSIQCSGAHAGVKGCGFGISNGQALAVAWTEAIAVAAAGAIDGSGKTAFCQSDISALIPVLASAYASSHSQLCAKASGPISVVAFQNSFQNSIATAMGDAFATASARVCGHLAEATCTGNAGTSGPSSGSTGGGINGGVFTSPTSQGMSTGTVGGQAIAPFDATCRAMAVCCGAVSFPCNCPGCPGPYAEFLSFEQTPTGPAKMIRSGESVCFCLLAHPLGR